MKEKGYKHFGAVLDKDLHYKLKYISAYNGRSMVGEIRYSIYKHICAFEEKNGVIELPKEEEN